MKQHILLLAAALCASLDAGAAALSLSGHATYQNDKIVIDFQVAAGSTVNLWTDSWQSGLNFDPQLFLTRGGVIEQADNDGGSLINASAGYYDAGLQFTAAADGLYRLVLDASSNDPLGATLADGFTYDAEAPIKLADWNQPGYDVNKNDQKGGFWRVNFTGIEQANRVPEPASAALVMAGVLAMSLVRRRR